MSIQVINSTSQAWGVKGRWEMALSEGPLTSLITQHNQIQTEIKEAQKRKRGPTSPTPHTRTKNKTVCRPGEKG